MNNLSTIRSWVRENLRKSEKFFETDMVYAAKGGFWLTFGHTFNNLISFLLIIFLANLLPKETYGMYRYILSLAAVVNIFSLTGMNSAVAKAVAGGDDGSFRKSIKYQLRWNLMMLIVFLFLSGYYFLKNDSLLSLSFLIMGLFIPPTLALNTYGAYLEGKKNFKFLSLFGIFSTVIYAVGMIVTVLLSKETIWLIIAYTGTTFLANLLFYFLTIFKYNPPEGQDSSGAISYGRNLTFIGFMEPIGGQIDKIILTHFWGPAQLAVYTIAMAIPGRIITFLKKLVALGFPKFATKTPKEINYIFYKRIFQGVAVGAIFSLLYIAVAPYLFKYMLPKYSEAIIYSQILSLSFVFAIPNRYISLLMVSQKFLRPIFFNGIFQTIITIGLYVLLGTIGGIMGLVIAFTFKDFISILINISVWKIASKNKIN